MHGKRRSRGGQASFPAQILCLALFFLGGVILGQILSAKVPETAGQELAEYLHGYLSLENERSPLAALSTLILYIRYPLTAVLLGFASIGVVLLPLTTVAFGFFLSFSVCCFTAAFGPEGTVLAAAVFGLRCLISLPCYFLLAVPAWEASAALALSVFGRGRHSAPIRCGRPFWRRLGLCAAVLLAGVCLEWICSPWLLHLALTRVFT